MVDITEWLEIHELPPVDELMKSETIVDITEWTDELANRGLLVETSALDGDFERESFRIF
jgi:hypothetical protein